MIVAELPYYTPPEPFRFTNNHGWAGMTHAGSSSPAGDAIDGLLYMPPPSYPRTSPMPTVLYVYGGPGVQARRNDACIGPCRLECRTISADRHFPCVFTAAQIIHNEYKALKLIRLSLLASAGFIVLAIDGRGATNRGLAFESRMQHAMVCFRLYRGDD